MSAVSPPTVSRRLHLRANVFFCVSEGQGVFLDLAQDDYSAIPLPADLFRDDADTSETAIRAAFEPFRSELIAAQLLTDSEAEARSLVSFKSLVRPATHIFCPDDQRAFGLTGEAGKRARIHVRDVIAFLLASRRAARRLRRMHIFDVVQKVRSRKIGPNKAVVDLDAYRRHTAIFRRLRPWYPQGYLCLYDGLALLEFLATRDLFPEWVFGVQAQPFGAHCWVQVGDVLLNESLEYAGQFTPIMVV